MPAVLQQLDGMTVSEKMRIMEYLLKSITQSVEAASASAASSASSSFSERVHALRGIVRLPEDFDERKFKSERLSSRLEV